MINHVDKRSSIEHARKYNTPESSEVQATILGGKDGEVGTRDIVLRKRGTINRNGSQVLDKTPIVHCSYDPLSYVLLFPDGRDGWYEVMVI